MKNTFRSLMLGVALVCGACGDPESDDAASGDVDAPSEGLETRNARYCEILLGYREGTKVRLDVWNTLGLNDCPAEAWGAIDPDAIKAENQAIAIVMNGPRYFVLDGFAETALNDDAVKTFGGIEMRKPAELYVSLSDLSGSSDDAYATRQVERDTTYVYKAGEMVYEIVDADGQVWVMQSYNGEQGEKTAEELVSMGEGLTLPEGWTFRARSLSEDLLVTAVDNVASVLRDSAGSTYQLSQQTR